MNKRPSLGLLLLAGSALGGAVIGIHGVPEAARTTATAIAEVIAAPSGISSTSNFEVGLPPVTETQIVIEVEAESEETGARLEQALDDARLISQPATFSISGEPYQVFSVAVPTTSTTTTSTFGDGQAALVVFSDYSHSAGASPTIDPDGKALFAVGARVEFGVDDQGLFDDDDGTLLDDGEAFLPNADEGSDDFSALFGDETASEDDDDSFSSISVDEQPLGSPGLQLGLSDTDGLLTASGTSDGTIASALRQHNPFRFAVDPRFLNVLVSYN